MALKIDITDDKGVKTRYHAVKSYQLKDGKLEVTVKSWVNADTRDAERLAEGNNSDAKAYDDETDRLRSELDSLSLRLANGEDELADQVVALTDQVNERTFSTDRPLYVPVVERSYREETVKMDYFEPLSLEAIYAKLSAEGGRYQGAESI